MGGLAGRGGTRAPSACARRILRVVPVPIKDYTSLSGPRCGTTDPVYFRKAKDGRPGGWRDPQPSPAQHAHAVRPASGYRTSATSLAANQLRLLFSAFASILPDARQANASRHPPGPRHRRNAPAQDSQDRRPRHGVGAPPQSRHGLRTPLRLGLRPRPRAIIRVACQAGRSRPSPPHPSWDPCAPGPFRFRASFAHRFARPQLRKLPSQDHFPHSNAVDPATTASTPAYDPFPQSSACRCENCG